MTISRAVKLTGTGEVETKSRRLSAGPLSVEFSAGALRYIRYRGTEVLRAIAWLARDRSWGTYAPEISALRIRESAGGFSVSYRARCADAEQALAYDVTITGAADGTLTVSATGTPETDFRTNRTGFVVLHPLEGVAGAPVRILHTDGKAEKSRFPKAISPGQPVFGIRALSHQVMPGVTATVTMEGDLWEMEDHRNWMDASYKTYVRSLLDPWPYTLSKAEAFTQTITLSFTGKPRAARRGGGEKPIALTVGSARGRLPALGLGVGMAEAAAAVQRADLIAAARPAHLVCQIDGREPGAAAAAEAFARLSEHTGAPVHLEIILPAKQPAAVEMRAIAEAAGTLSPEAVIVTQAHDLASFQPGSPRPPGPDFAEMAAAARAAFPQARIGGGMLSYFTELNRKRPPQGLFDFITHTVCPIVHAADDVSVMETLEALSHIIASTRAIIGARTPYHWGPSTIAARANPYGSRLTPNPEQRRVCLTGLDPRQRGLFAAAWTLGLIAAAAEGGVTALAAGAATGPRGAVYQPMDHAQPGYDDVAGARVYPVYHVIAGLAASGGCPRLATSHDGLNRISALALRAASGPELWIANRSAEPQAVRITGLAGKAILTRLDAASFTRAVKNQPLKPEPLARLGTLELSAYEVARVTPR